MNRPPDRSKHLAETIRGNQERSRESSERLLHANETGSSIGERVVIGMSTKGK